MGYQAPSDSRLGLLWGLCLSVPHTESTVYGKTFEGENFRDCAQNTPFTGKLSRCIRPMPLCTVHSK